MAYDNEGNYIDETGMGPNTDFAVQSDQPANNFAVQNDQPIIDQAMPNPGDYGAMNPDVYAAAQQALGAGADQQALNDFYNWHYSNYGQGEGREAPASFSVYGGAPITSLNNFSVYGDSAPARNYLTNADISYRAPVNVDGEEGYYDEEGNYVASYRNPYASGTVSFGDLTIAAPTLHQASQGFATPYYEARTNTGELAAAVMAGEGQGVRLLDGAGKVIYQGTGPDAARDATAIANHLSSTGGKQAAWNLQIEDPNNKGQYNQAGYESIDKAKKPGFLSTLLEVAAPIVLGALFPPLAGIGGALGLGGTAAAMANPFILHTLANTGVGLMQGEKFGTALKGGLTEGTIAGLTGGVLNKVPAGSPVMDVVNAPNKLITKGVNTVVNAIPGAGDVLSTINSGLSSGLHAVGDITRPVLSTAGDLVSGAHNFITGAPASVTPPLTGPNYVSPVTVTAPVITPGVPSSLLSRPPSLNGETQVSNLEVNPVTQTPSVPLKPGENYVEGVSVSDKRKTPSTPTTETPLKPGENYVEGVTVSDTPKTPSTPTPPSTTSPPVTTPPPVTEPPTTPPTYPPNVVTPAVPTPPVTTPPTGTMSLDQLRAQLAPTFRAQLPASRMNLARRPVNMSLEDWLRYAIHPRGVSPRGGEEAFFDYAVNPLMAPVKAARGGHMRDFAVDGPGTGRSDSIPARLSDGEYVIDAETVALLGDGSSKAGAKKLDKMRVNVRKHKGRNLAKGRFSVDAKAPEAYLSGGRA